MAQGRGKGDDRAQGGGKFSQPVRIFGVDDVKDADGGPVRIRRPAPEWVGFAEIDTFLSTEQRQALRETGETWATIAMRFADSQIARQGWQLLVVSTGEFWEIRGVNLVGMRRKRTEYTCRLVK
jgi:hypothetical protein